MTLFDALNRPETAAQVISGTVVGVLTALGSLRAVAWRLARIERRLARLESEASRRPPVVTSHRPA